MGSSACRSGVAEPSWSQWNGLPRLSPRPLPLIVGYICPDCVGELFLRRLVSTAAVEQYPCAYCESEGPPAEISFVAQQCSEVISTFFEVSSLTMAVVHFNKDPAGQVRMENPMTFESFGSTGSSRFWLM